MKIKNVIARRAKPDAAMPLVVADHFRFLRRKLRGLPRQCVHWLAMTAFFQVHTFKHQFIGLTQFHDKYIDLPGKQSMHRFWFNEKFACMSAPFLCLHSYVGGGHDRPARGSTAKWQVFLENVTTLSHNRCGAVMTAPYRWRAIEHCTAGSQEWLPCSDISKRIANSRCGRGGLFREECDRRPGTGGTNPPGSG